MALYYIGDVAYDGNYLEHFGIKGMKWYVRRYQNPDGTWTEAGKKRYGNPRSGTRHAQSDAKAYRKIAKKAQKTAKNQEDFVQNSYEEAGKAMEAAYQAFLKGKDTNSKNLVGLAKEFVERGDMIKKSAAESAKKAEEYLRYADALDKPVDYMYKLF